MATRQFVTPDGFVNETTNYEYATPIGFLNETADAGGTVTAVGASSGVATAQATSASTSAQVAASAGVATAQATGSSTSAQVASTAGTVLTADFIGASTSAQVGSSSGSVTIADFINGTATLATAVGSADGVATVLGISQAVDTARSKGGFDPYYYKRRNKRRKDASDVNEFLLEVSATDIDAAPEQVASQAEAAKIAATQYLALRNTALQAEKAQALSHALKEINSFYSNLRAEIKRQQEEDEEDDLLLLS